MTGGNDAKRMALKIEEAALLPALPRIRGAGGAALQSALQSAREMGKKRLSNAVSAGILWEAPPAEAAAGTYRRTGKRAALNHVLKKR